VAQTATIVPFSSIINLPLEVEIKILTKYIYPGAHVKVVSGVHMGQTGRVVSLKDTDDDLLAVIITDGVNTEILTKTATLQITSEVSTGQGNLMGYELFDLVALNDNEIAIVLKVGSEKLFVMNHLGSTKHVLPLELQGKRNTQSQRSKAFDSENSTIIVGDSVRLKSSEDGFTGLGTVKHINKGTLWIHSNQYLKNSGVCVVRARNCTVAGNKGGSSSSGLNPYGNGNASSMGPPTRAPTRSFKNERSSDIGKTVRIIKGNCKGLLAQVYAVSGDNYLVEILAKMMKTTVPRAHCTVCGDKNGSIEGRSQSSTRSNIDLDIGTPFMGVNTPMYGAETPKWGSSTTPLHTPSQFTPSHGSNDNSSDYWKISDRDREQLLDDPADNWGADSSVGPSPSIGGSSNSNYKPIGSDRAPPSSNYTSNFSAGTNSTRMSETPRSEHGSEGRSSKVSFKDWIENMILVKKDGDKMGSYAVIFEKPNNDYGTVKVQYINSLGKLEPGIKAIVCSDFAISEPKKGDRVYLLAGKNKGQHGEVKSFVKSDAIVILNGKDTLLKIDILATMHTIR
jgi:transcription elongation factor